jgi:acyl dehydratase
MLNRDFIGREYPASSTYEVGREHIRRFAEAVGDTSPACTDPEAARALGHPDVIAPPTFLTVLNFRFAK